MFFNNALQQISAEFIETGCSKGFRRCIVFHENFYIKKNNKRNIFSYWTEQMTMIREAGGDKWHL